MTTSSAYCHHYSSTGDDIVQSPCDESSLEVGTATFPCHCFLLVGTATIPCDYFLLSCWCPFQRIVGVLFRCASPQTIQPFINAAHKCKRVIVFSCLSANICVCGNKITQIMSAFTKLGRCTDSILVQIGQNLMSGSNSPTCHIRHSTV